MLARSSHCVWTLSVFARCVLHTFLFHALQNSGEGAAGRSPSSRHSTPGSPLHSASPRVESSVDLHPAAAYSEGYGVDAADVVVSALSDPDALEVGLQPFLLAFMLSLPPPPRPPPSRTHTHIRTIVTMQG